MKILINVTYYYPHWTGLTRYAVTLAEGLAKRGHEVTVLTCRHDKGLTREENIRGVRVLRCEPTLKISRTIVSSELIRKLPDLIRETEAVIGFMPLNEAAVIALLGRVYNKRVILVHNGDLVLPKGLTNRIIEGVFFWSSLAAIKLSQGIVVNTKDYAQESRLLRLVKEKWRVVVPPITVTQAGLGVEKGLRKKVGPAKYVVGFAGRFVEEKGFDILLRAMPMIEKIVGGVKFAFAGEVKIDYETTYESNRKLISDNADRLVILGRLNTNELMGFYKMIDTLVISSRSDFFPFVQAEAMLSGVPIVVTDIPGARWLVKKTGAGVVVKPNDPEALARGIRDVLMSKTKYKKNTELAKTIFDYSMLISEYEKLVSG